MANPEPITAPSGRVYQWTQPPRRVHWKHGRAGRTFAAKIEEMQNGEGAALSDDEKALRVFESMSESELERLEVYANDVLGAGLGHPPAEDMPEIDYWFLFARSVYGVKDMPVKTTEGVMSAEALENFPSEPSLQADGESGEDVSVQPGPTDGDS